LQPTDASTSEGVHIKKTIIAAFISIESADERAGPSDIGTKTKTSNEKKRRYTMALFRSQPHSTPSNAFIDFQIIDVKVVDPTAMDPDAAVFMLKPGQPFTFVVKVTGTGSLWTGLNIASAATWQTKFYANALGIDVQGEKNFSTAPGALTPDTNPNTYRVELPVPGGLTTEGVYELGALVRLPATGINGSADEYHIDVAAN